MGFDGSGTFVRTFDWTTDAANGVKIRADRHDAEMDDFAGLLGLSNCLTKDGQTQPVADIPMAGFKLINVGEPSNITDVATKKYVDAHKEFITGIDITGAIRFMDGDPPVRIASIVPYTGDDPERLEFKLYDKTGLTQLNNMALLPEGIELDVGGLVTFTGEGDEAYLHSSLVLPQDPTVNKATLTIWDDDANPPTAATVLQRITWNEEGQRIRAGKLIFERSTGVIRGAVNSVHAGEGATVKVEAYDPAGVLAGYLDVNDANIGAYSTNGTIRFGKVNGTARGLISAETASNAGKVTIQALNNDQSVANQTIMDLDSFELKTGSFVSRDGGANKRAEFGFDPAFGTSIIYRDSSGNLQSQVTLNANGFYMRGPTGSIGAYRAVGVNGNTRGLIKWNTENAEASLAQIFTYQANGNKTQVFEVDSAGARLTDGASAGDVLTTGNFPSKLTTSGAVDFPVGSTVLVSIGSILTRNQTLSNLRIDSVNAGCYVNSGTGGAALTGTWLHSGQSNAAPFTAMARRVS